MKISVITEDSNLVEYLKGNPSLTVENVYADLETEYDRFINDLNRVDVLLMVDKSDLSSQLALLSKAVSSGGAYLFKVQEIVIVTYQDLMNSPTRNAEDKFNAFVELMAEHKYVVRVVKYPSFDFQAIYDGIIKETSLEESDLRKFIKYKVAKSSGGVDIKPKKSSLTLKQDKLDERPALLKQDSMTIEMVHGRTINIEKEPPSIIRTQTNMAALESVTHQTTQLVLVSGVKYSGKSTFCLKTANELNKNGFSSLIVDASGRRDMDRLLRFNNSSFSVLSGESIFVPTDDSTVVIQLQHLSPTASFLSSLTHLSTGKAAILCEIDPQYINNYIHSNVGETKLVIVTEYDFVKMRDTATKLQGIDSPLRVVINAREHQIETDTIIANVTDFFPNVQGVGFMTDMVETVMMMGVC